MKAKFKVKAKDETSVTVEVTVDTAKYTLTRDELRAFKHRMQNRVYQVLRDTGYDVAQIKLS